LSDTGFREYRASQKSEHEVKRFKIKVKRYAVASLKKISPNVFPFFTLVGTASIGAT
jgi:hypothetical protein